MAEKKKGGNGGWGRGSESKRLFWPFTHNLDASPSSRNKGKFLELMTQITGARRVLELGTLGGYSACWISKGLPSDGRLLTLELEPRYAEVAKANIARAGHADKVEIMVGRASELLAAMVAQSAPPFDLIFIDANKDEYPTYFSLCLQLSRPGTVMIIDNVVLDGKVVQEAGADANALGVRRMNEIIAAEPRVSTTVLQTVGNKGYDGFALVRVLA
jgi:predicted O-methyltransferase YrrM